jgi:prepilin-type N-terminal cleavage/methylation domain-containing protein
MISFISFDKLHNQRGFSLVEMAIVLVILGFLLAGVLAPLSSQREVSQRQAIERQLQEIREALVGYAQANGALPCPVQAGTGNVIQPVPTAITNCNNNFNSLPYATLGLQGNILNNNLVDDYLNYFRYRITRVGPWAYARSPIPVATPAIPADLQVCNSDIGVTLTDCGPGRIVATDLVAVVTAIRDNVTPSAEETQNTDNNPVFIAHEPNDIFDDVSIWIAPAILTYEMTRAGR